MTPNYINFVIDQMEAYMDDPNYYDRGAERRLTRLTGFTMYQANSIIKNWDILSDFDKHMTIIGNYVLNKPDKIDSGFDNNWDEDEDDDE